MTTTSSSASQPGFAPGRRAALAGLAALGLGTVVPTLVAAPARAATAPDAAPETASADPVQLTLPAPTGPHRVGNVALHLIDRSRRDPWVPSHPPRELMIGIWYPAHDVEGHALVPWLPANARTSTASSAGTTTTCSTGLRRPSPRSSSWLDQVLGLTRANGAGRTGAVLETPAAAAGQSTRVSTRGPSSVIAMVCSECEPREPSWKRSVQPSGSV